MSHQIYCKAFDELSLQELYDVMALRQEVFVIEQDCPYLDADGKDQHGHHLMFYNETNQLIAYARLLPRKISYEDYPSIGRIVTSDLVRGQGVGKALMVASIHWMNQLYPAPAIKISAQSHLIPFYQSFGFQPVGKEYLEDDIPHTGMVRQQ